MGATYEKGIEAARQLEAVGLFSPAAVPPVAWALLQTAFAGLFPHDDIGCEHGGCPGKVSRAYLRVINELRSYNQNPASLAQRSAVSQAVTTQPTTNPNAATAAQSTMSKDARQFHFKEGQSYMEFGAQTAYTNNNLTDKIARRILANDPTARKRFVEFPDEQLDGEQAGENEHNAGKVTTAYGRPVDANPAPLAASTEHVATALGSASTTPAAAAPAQVSDADTAPNAAPTGTLGGDAPGHPAHDGKPDSAFLTASTGGQATGILTGKPLDTAQQGAADAAKNDAGSTSDAGSTTSGAAGSTSTESGKDSAGGSGQNNDGADAGESESVKGLLKLTRPELDKQYLDLVPGGDPGKFANKLDIATAIADALADSHEV